jgi:hypothetical protein
MTKSVPCAPLLLAILTAGAASAQVPVVDCVVQNPQTLELVAYFGYTGNAHPPVTIPDGGSNSLTGGFLLGSVPTTFGSPAEHILFAVKFSPTGNVRWILNGTPATADASMVSACQTPVGKKITNYVAQLRCWDLFASNTCDPSDDLDGDGYCTILDCRGPQGSLGAVGPQGNTGDQGPVGPTGAVPLLQTITSSPGAARATASCSSTQFLVTGGGSCDVPNLAGMGRLASSVAADDGNGWSVSCNAGQATAVAVCAAK